MTTKSELTDQVAALTELTDADAVYIDELETAAAGHETELAAALGTIGILEEVRDTYFQKAGDSAAKIEELENALAVSQRDVTFLVEESERQTAALDEADEIAAENEVLRAHIGEQSETIGRLTVFSESASEVILGLRQELSAAYDNLANGTARLGWVSDIYNRSVVANA